MGPDFTAPDGEQLSGEMVLMIQVAVRQQDIGLLRQTIRETAISLDDANAKWVFRTVSRDFTPELQAWFDQAIETIRNRSNDDD